MNNQIDDAKPKVWKLMLLSFVFVYLAMNIVFFLFGSYLFAMSQLLRTFFMAIIFVPLFGIGIPSLHKKFYKWTVK